MRRYQGRAIDILIYIFAPRHLLKPFDAGSPELLGECIALHRCLRPHANRFGQASGHRLAQQHLLEKPRKRRKREQKIHDPQVKKGKARRALSGGWDAQAGDWDACPIPSSAPLASCPWRSRAISILGTPAFPVLCRTISGNAHESRAMERAEPKHNLPTPSKGAATLPFAASPTHKATSENR